jgi:TonB family protein
MRTLLFSLLLTCGLALQLSAQVHDPPPTPQDGGDGYVPEEPIFEDASKIDKQPEPINMKEFYRGLGDHEVYRKKGIQGNVIVRVFLDKQGKYVKHTILRSPHPSLSDVVSKTIPVLRFTPAIHQGEPVSVWIDMVVRF